MKRRVVLLPAGSLLIIVLALLLFTDIAGLAIFDALPKLRLGRTTTRSGSIVELQQVREIYELNTVSYVHRSVFPYDYFDDTVSIADILRKLQGTDRTIRDTLSESEYRHFRAYNLASDVGMQLGGRRNDFIVVTVIVTAGFDLSATVLFPPEDSAVTDGTSVDPFRVEPIALDDGSEGRRIYVAAPPPSITSAIVEDLRSDEYLYPDVAVSADGWGRIAAFVREEAMKLPELSELLAVASENGSSFVRETLLQAGYDEVVVETVVVPAE